MNGREGSPVLIFSLLFFLAIPVGVRAQSDFSGIDHWLEQHTAEMGGRSVLMICKDGQIIYEKAVNKMNARQKIAARFLARRQGKDPYVEDFTPESRQLIASCSKWLSAALVMTFVDEGRLHLTDTVGSYLPVLAAHGKGKITISDCLSHLTGIKAPPLRENLQEMRNISSMDEAMEQIATLPMEGSPGEVFHYSNTGLQIAGAVLEKISGRSFETLFAERIARPLGMTHTDFGKGNLALPAGGAVSTAADYMKFLEMILNKGVYKGHRVLSEESIAEMKINRLTPGVKIAYSPAEAGNFGYGFGEWIMAGSGTGRPGKAFTSPGLFGSFPWVDCDSGYCAFLMTFYLKNKGRNDRYLSLKKLVDKSVH